VLLAASVYMGKLHANWESPCTWACLIHVGNPDECGKLLLTASTSVRLPAGNPACTMRHEMWGQDTHGPLNAATTVNAETAKRCWSLYSIDKLEKGCEGGHRLCTTAPIQEQKPSCWPCPSERRKLPGLDRVADVGDHQGRGRFDSPASGHGLGRQQSVA